MKEAVFFKELENKEVQCHLCPHNCKISPEKRGICGVRKNIDGKLFSLVYDKVSTMHIDPIEKKPLYQFYPGERAMSIATMGCNLSCKFCQNADLSQSPRQAEDMIVGEKISPEEIVEAAKKNNCKIIAYTYSEPTIFYELAYDTAKLAHENNIKNVFISNGYINEEPLKEISPYLDAANIDLKSFDDDFYKKVCGASLKPVLNTIKLMHKQGIWAEITTLVIPKENDSEKELNQIAEFIASVDKNIPWHISRFYPHYRMDGKFPTSINTLERAYELGKKAGLNYIYLGNVPGNAKDDTYCPSCSELIIKRNGYRISEINLEKNKCSSCGHEITGRY